MCTMYTASMERSIFAWYGKCVNLTMLIVIYQQISYHLLLFYVLYYYRLQTDLNQICCLLAGALKISAWRPPLLFYESDSSQDTSCGIAATPQVCHFICTEHRSLLCSGDGAAYLTLTSYHMEGSEKKYRRIVPDATAAILTRDRSYNRN